MSELPRDANGNPIYPEGMIEAHTAFIAHFNEEGIGGLQERVKRGLAAALPLLKDAWETERRTRADYLPDAAAVDVAACSLRVYLGSHREVGTGGGWDDIDAERRKPWLDAAASAARIFRDRWAVDQTEARLAAARERARYVQEQLLQIEDCFDGGAPVEALARRVVAAWKEIDKTVGFHGPPFPALIDRVNALNMRAKAEQDGRKQAETVLAEAKSLLRQAADSLATIPTDTYRPHDPETARYIETFLKADPTTIKPENDELDEMMESLQEATTGLAEVLDDWPEEPTWQSRLKWLVSRAKLAEQHPASVRIMAVVESFAKHADDSGWHNTAEELRRKAAEALNGAGDTDPLPRIVTDAMIASAIHYLHANGIDMLNRNLLGLLAVVVRAKP